MIEQGTLNKPALATGPRHHPPKPIELLLQGLALTETLGACRT